MNENRSLAFSLKAFVCFLMASSILIFALCKGNHSKRKTVHAIRQMGGTVEMKVPDYPFIPKKIRDLFATVDSVLLKPSKTFPADVQVRKVCLLKNLRRLQVGSTVEAIVEFGAEGIAISDKFCITDDGLDLIRKNLLNLSELEFVADKCSKSGIQMLEQDLPKTNIKVVLLSSYTQ